MTGHMVRRYATAAGWVAVWRCDWRAAATDRAGRDRAAAEHERTGR